MTKSGYLGIPSKQQQYLDLSVCPKKGIVRAVKFCGKSCIANIGWKRSLKRTIQSNFAFKHILFISFIWLKLRFSSVFPMEKFDMGTEAS